ncbi:unnamed protein product [Mytilus edulis]|uniref:Uncharacterized protein n=1 Tax=Mytilus edulis TaxID=6550 RepID=A0A8S3S100_MYTED|nr:unnamed protein product [Mytilus edulis]
MDEETEKTYIKRLDDLVRREKDVSEKLDNMEDEINVMRDSVTDIKTKGETHEIVFKREIEEVKRTTTYIQEEKTLLESKQLELQQVFKQKTTELESKSSYLTEQMSKITTDIKDVNTERKDVTDVVEKLQLEQINIGTNIKEMKLKMESQSISISDFEKTIEVINKMFENIEKKHQTIFLEIEKLNALLHDSIQPHIKVQIKNQIEIWKTKDEKQKNNEFLTNIPDDFLELYLERFQNDWSSGNVGTLFECSNMRKSVFRQDLIDYLTQLSRSQQVKLANTQDTMVCKEDPGLGNTP